MLSLNKLKCKVVFGSGREREEWNRSVKYVLVLVLVLVGWLHTFHCLCQCVFFSCLFWAILWLDARRNVVGPSFLLHLFQTKEILYLSKTRLAYARGERAWFFISANMWGLSLSLARWIPYTGASSFMEYYSQT